MFQWLTGKSKIDKLKEQVELQGFQNELQRRQYQAKLQESITAPQFGQLLNPLIQMFDGQAAITPFFANRRNNSNFIFLTEWQLDWIRWSSRLLYELSPTARAVVEHFTNYVIKKGFSYNCVPKPNRTMSKEQCNLAQQIIDDFMDANNWKIKEVEIYQRTRRDGECALRFFPQYDEPTQLRFVEPEQIRSPDASSDWSFGILTPPDDYARALAYYFTPDCSVNSDLAEVVDAEEMHFIKQGTDENVKRGLSTYFSCQQGLAVIDRLMHCATLGEAGRQAICYIITHEQASQAAIQSLQAANADYEYTEPNSFGSNKIITAQKAGAGERHEVPKGYEYSNPPQGNGQNFQLVIQKAFDVIASVWQAPSWMTSGSSNDNSYASALVAESPLHRAVERQQEFYAFHTGKIMQKILQIAVKQGDLSQETYDDILVQVETPSAVVRGTKEEVDKNMMLYECGLLSARTFAQRCELDYEAEMANKKEEQPLNTNIEPTPSEVQTSAASYKRDIRKDESI